jgi:pimeloyl-ACP methyl ester carboxylesterase
MSRFTALYFTKRIFRMMLLVAACACASPLSAGANGCDASIPSPPPSNNSWHCLNNSNTVVVFVHGLNSSSVDAWRRLKTKDDNAEHYWPSLVLEDKNLKKPSVYLAGFYTEPGGSNYTIADASNEFFSSISVATQGQQSVLDKSDILFVAHSLGGVVVRETLVRHADAFSGKRIGLLLVASPSYGSNHAKALVDLAKITRQKMVEDLAYGSQFIKNLDDDFRQVLLEQKAVRIIGRELIENHFVDLSSGGSVITDGLAKRFGWVLAKVYGTRIVEADSAARYFPQPVVIPSSDHFTIAKPDGLNHPSHRELVLLHDRLARLSAPACESPSSFRLVLDFKPDGMAEPLPEGISEEMKSSLPILRFWRTRPDGTLLPGIIDDAKLDPIAARHVLVPSPPLPCAGDAFRARFRRVPVTSRLETRASALTDLCFKRGKATQRDGSAFLRCEEGRGCRPDADAPGFAESCERAGWLWPKLVGSARAQAAMPKEHWLAPSITSLLNLPVQDRPGYTEFSINSNLVAGAEEATHLSFGVTVNNTPIMFDGIEPHQELQLFNSYAGVRINFAIENLGFSGGDNGYEKIDLDIKYWKNSVVIKEAKISKQYVSYRHAPLENISDLRTNDVYRWVGHYRPAENRDRYEIVIGVSKDPNSIAEQKKLLDTKKLIYAEMLVVGIVRPPRVNNTYSGVTLSSGQIRSSFTEQEAKTLCRWLVRDAAIAGWMRNNAYLYEFPASMFNVYSDRGVQRATCKDVVY